MKARFCAFKRQQVKKIEKKLNKFLGNIGKKDTEKMIGPMIFVFLILALSVMVSSQIAFWEVKKISLEKEVSPPNYALEAKIKNLVKGYPIENMISQIARKDEIVAAYLVGIAKKESNWGKRVPVLDGEDCYNYWGYRETREKMGSGGHTCFNSPSDAISTVSKRLSYFIEERGLENPEDLVVWKCGSSCEGQNKESVNKWISDVDYYYHKVME